MNESRRHPDLFTEAEALAYLGIAAATPEEQTRAIGALRENNGLVGMRFGGRTYMYHRNHLDECVARTFGVADSANSATSASAEGGKRCRQRKGPTLQLTQ